MLGWKIVEGEQLLAILDQAFGGLGIFCLEGFNEQIKGLMRILAGLGLPDVVQHLLGLGLGMFPSALTLSRLTSSTGAMRLF